MIWEVRNGGNDANGGGFRGGAVVSTPAAPGVSATSGGAVAVNTYFVVVTISDGNGETPKSAETSVTTTSSNKTITVTAPTDPVVAGATWNAYVATASGGPYWSQSTGNGFGSNLAIAATPATSGTQAPGVDYSQQNSAQVAVNNSTITATTAAANSNVITLTGYTPTAADVGNVYHATGGTNIRTGWYEITAWTATTWTVTGGGNLTTATAAGSALTGNMGGAFATPGGWGVANANSDTVAGNVLYIKYNATAYTIGSTANVAAGRLVTSNTPYITGYDTTRTKANLDANRPILDAGAASMTVMTTQNNTSTMRQIVVTNSAARASVTGIIFAGTCESCKVDACTTGITNSGGNPGIGRDLWVNNAGTDGFTGNNYLRCTVTGFGRHGFTTGNNAAIYVECVAKGGTGAQTGVGFNSNAGYLINCVSRDNAGATTDGFAGIVNAINCIAWNNGRYNFAGGTANPFMRIENCAGGSAGTANFNPTQIYGYLVRNFVTLSSDPHTNASGGDLSLNNTSGAGAPCRAAGLPGSTSGTQLPGLSATNSYPDIGVAQHSDASVPPTPTYFAY